MNTVTIFDGVITQEPKLKFTNNGSPVLTLNVGTSKRWKDKAGNQQEEKCYFEIVVWGKAAEGASKKAQRLGHVFCLGSFKMQSWEDKNSGEKRTKYIVAPNWPEWSNLCIYPPEERQERSQQGSRGQGNQRRQCSGDYDEYDAPNDDNIPF